MLLRALLPAAMAVVVAAPAHAAQASTTFTTVGESVFVVPPGVHRVDVALTGARGGNGFLDTWAQGGRGATVSGTLDVLPGARLYAEVGGPGADVGQGDNANALLSGGANGGGSGGPGGGGASDIRTAPASDAESLKTRLAVAGGGGGAAWDYLGSAHGGDAGMPGRGQGGGLPGTQTAGGAGGTVIRVGANGTAGSLGLGGTGEGTTTFRGGGGGGGLYGGGGGAGTLCSPCLQGGGGGGSSLVPTGGTYGLASKSDPARVTIAYERAQPAVSATRLDFPSTRPGAISHSRMLELRNTGTSTALILAGLSIDSDEFVLGASTCPGILAPGAKCRLAIRFTPSVVGARRSTLRIDSNGNPLTVALRGVSAAEPAIAPAAAAEPAGSPATAVAPVIQRTVTATARVTCVKKRCTVDFAGNAPKLTAATRVRATLIRSGRVYATADRVARRGTLRLVLKSRRAIVPGTYALTLRIGTTRTTHIINAT